MLQISHGHSHQLSDWRLSLTPQSFCVTLCALTEETCNQRGLSLSVIIILLFYHVETTPVSSCNERGNIRQSDSFRWCCERHNRNERIVHNDPVLHHRVSLFNTVHKDDHSVILYYISISAVTTSSPTTRLQSSATRWSQWEVQIQVEFR